MTKKQEYIRDAKNSLKAHIKFMQTLVEHLNGPNELLKSKAIFAGWVIHRFFNEKFMDELEQTVKEKTKPIGVNHV